MDILPNTAPVSDNTLEDDSVTWFKPASAATAKDTVYATGFGPLALSVAGSPYAAPVAGQRIMGLPLVVAPATNAQINFIDGGLMPNFGHALRISAPAVPRPTVRH